MTKNNNQAKCFLSTYNCKKAAGLTFALFSAISAAFSGLVVTYIKEAGADEIQLTRCVIQYLFTLPYMLYRHEGFFKDKLRTNVKIFVCAITGGMAFWFYNYSLKFIPLGDATSLNYVSVALVGFSSWICFREQYSALEGVLWFATMAGIVLIARPTFIFGNTAQIDLKGVAFALLSALSVTVNYITIHRMEPGVHYTLILIHYAWLIASLSLAARALKAPLSLPCLHDVIIMTTSCALALLAYVFTIQALQREKADHVAVVQTTQIVFSMLLEWLVLGYSPPWTSAVGSLLIFSCAVGLTVQKIRSHRAKAARDDLGSRDF